jgi:chromodomain-helicase-DNA-binding protein 7
MNWLCFNWHLKRGSILADEMGLGKTIQAISLLHYLQEFQMIDGPFIVIAPLSTIRNWHREIQKWTNMRSVMYHGDSEDREIMRNYEMMQPDVRNYFIGCFLYSFSFMQNTRSRGQLRIDVIVTNYESVITDAFFFRKFHWKCLVIDEAHRLKNKNSSLYREIESWKFDYPLMLTGTPIQNNVEELFALLHFIDPSRFANFDVLKEKLGEMKTAEELGILHSIMKPYLLRRVKADVEKSLAPKEETLIEVVLTNLQKKYYRAVYEKILGQLIADKKTNATALRNVCMQLRKVCNHPFLLDGVEELEVGHSHSEEETILKLIRASGKTIFLDKLLTKLYAENHRVLIFSQFKTVLDLLEDYVNFKNYKYERLDGGISGNERQDAIDRYSAADSDKFIFLLTTRAGGVGINLTAADTVIIFDSDWNPQQDIQAQARCHRIGQTKTVKIYRLITKDSYEMEMFKKSSMKLGLDKALLSGLEGSKNSKDSGPSNEELESLLKFGAYHVFKDDSEENDESAVFAEDIEHILSKAKTVQLVGNEEDGAFARVSFLSSTQDADVHVNDPDFWNKLGVKYLKKHNEFLDRRDRRTKMRRNSDDASKKDSDDDAFGSGKESSEYEISSSSSDEDDELGDGGVEQVSNSRWKRADWELFCSKLMDFGITNMKRCQINHEDDGNSDAELEMNAWMVIFCCYKYGNLPSNQRKLLLLLQEKLPHIVPESLRAERYWLGASSQDFVITVSTIPVDSILRKSKMVEYFTSNGKSLIDRIFSLYCLNLFFNAKELGVGAYNVAVPSGDKSLPSEKWLESEDIQLMQSIMENGYGEWNEDNFQNKFGGFLIRNNNEWPKKSVIEKRAKFLLRCVVRIVNLTFSYQMRVAPPPVPVKPVQPKPAQQQAKPVIPTMPAPRTQVIHSIVRFSTLCFRC